VTYRAKEVAVVYRLSKWDLEHQKDMVPINGGYQYVHRITGMCWGGDYQILCWLKEEGGGSCGV